MSPFFYSPFRDWQSLTAYIATNDLSQCDVETTEKRTRLRWKIEQLHRELKQTTGLGEGQCRRHPAQRNHIACCLWVWGSLRRAAQAEEGLLIENTPIYASVGYRKGRQQSARVFHWDVLLRTL